MRTPLYVADALQTIAPIAEQQAIETLMRLQRHRS